MFADFPYHQSILHSSEAVYEELPGFTEDIGECRTPSDLPAAALDYVEFIAEAIGVPIKLIGTGPGRDQVIWMDESAAPPACEPQPANGSRTPSGGGRTFRSSSSRSPRRMIRSAIIDAASSDAVPSVICTPKRPRRVQ